MWSAFNIPEPVKEHQFWAGRRFRFDFAWVKEKIAVEIEGGIWTQGRHSRGAGMAKDMEKYNMATKMGWAVFRFTPRDLKLLRVHEFISPLFEIK